MNAPHLPRGWGSRRAHDRQCATIGVGRQLIQRIDLEILDQRIVRPLTEVPHRVTSVAKPGSELIRKC